MAIRRRGAVTLLSLALGCASCDDRIPQTSAASTAATEERPSSAEATALSGSEHARLQAMIDSWPAGNQIFRIDRSGVVHIQSGLYCPDLQAAVLRMDRGFRGLQLAAYPGDNIGSDVACIQDTDWGRYTVRATRASSSFAAHLQAMISSVRGNHPGAVPISDPVNDRLDRRSAMPVARSFGVAGEDAVTITSLWTAQEGDWFITVIANYSDRERLHHRSYWSDERIGPEMLAVVMMVGAQSAIRARFPAPP